MQVHSLTTRYVLRSDVDVEIDLEDYPEPDEGFPEVASLFRDGIDGIALVHLDQYLEALSMDLGVSVEELEEKLPADLDTSGLYVDSA